VFNLEPNARSHPTIYTHCIGYDYPHYIGDLFSNKPTMLRPGYVNNVTSQ